MRLIARFYSHGKKAPVAEKRNVSFFQQWVGQVGKGVTREQIFELKESEQESRIHSEVEKGKGHDELKPQLE